MMYYLAKNNYFLKNVNLNLAKGTAGFTDIRYLEDFVMINANNKAEAEALAVKYFSKKDYTTNKTYKSENIIVFDTITDTYFAEDESE